jgi:hypothetical protein
MHSPSASMPRRASNQPPPRPPSNQSMCSEPCCSVEACTAPPDKLSQDARSVSVENFGGIRKSGPGPGGRGNASDRLNGRGGADNGRCAAERRAGSEGAGEGRPRRRIVFHRGRNEIPIVLRHPLSILEPRLDPQRGSEGTRLPPWPSRLSGDGSGLSVRAQSRPCRGRTHHATATRGAHASPIDPRPRTTFAAPEKLHRCI